MLAFVINKHGKPLMPCHPARARILLKEGKAKVIRRKPFIIQLLYGSSGYKQPIILGVDAGYSSIGLSAITEKEEVFRAEVKLRDNMVKLNSERRIYRRARRGRKRWHRKARFLNRKKSEGWLAPSIQHKLDSHLRIIEKIKEILPVTKIVIEVASFDTQKMQNPEIKGIEYQQGELQSYEVKEYLLEKWGRRCAYCGRSNIPLEVEDIVPKSRGGTNRVSNLTLACRRCNLKKGNRTAAEFGYPGIQEEAKKTLKAVAFMNVVRWRLVNELREMGNDVFPTYGYITKQRRKELGLEKSHSNDAFVIAGGKGQSRLSSYYLIEQVRRQNRKLFRGKRSHIRNTGPRFIKGFQRYDKVLYRGEECFIYGRRRSGYFNLRKLTGDVIHESAKVEELRLLESFKTLLWEVRSALPPRLISQSVGVSVPDLR